MTFAWYIYDTGGRSIVHRVAELGDGFVETQCGRRMRSEPAERDNDVGCELQVGEHVPAGYIECLWCAGDWRRGEE